MTDFPGKALPKRALGDILDCLGIVASNQRGRPLVPGDVHIHMLPGTRVQHDRPGIRLDNLWIQFLTDVTDVQNIPERGIAIREQLRVGFLV
jgi:hypothetical protein